MSADLILNLISEALDGKYILEADEGGDKKELKTGTGTTLRLPRFQINEKDWGRRVTTEDRTTIERIGDNLPGTMPMDRVVEIQKFLDAEVDTDTDATVGEIMAKLMFLDLFAACVLKFNESVAGFLFESLFAGIFKGFQIPAKQAQTTGDIMIPDLNPEVGELERTTTGPGDVSYSFKLLTDGGTSIGGSMFDLFNGVCLEGKEIYLVGLKSDQGEDSITINMYEFPISEDNWFKATAKYTTTTTPTFDYEPLANVLGVLNVADVEEVPSKQILAADGETDLVNAIKISKDKKGNVKVKPAVKGAIWKLNENKLPYSAVGSGRILSAEDDLFVRLQTGEKTTINLSKGPGEQAYGVFMPGGSQHEAFKEKTGKYFEELIADPNEYKKPEYKMFDREESPLNLSPAFQKQGVQFVITQDQMKKDQLGLGVKGPATIVLDRQKFLDAANRNAAKVGKEIYQIFTDLANLVDNVSGYFLANSPQERNKFANQSRVEATRLARSAEENLVPVVERPKGMSRREYEKSQIVKKPLPPAPTNESKEFDNQLQLLMKEVFGK